MPIPGAGLMPSRMHAQVTQHDGQDSIGLASPQLGKVIENQELLHCAGLSQLMCLDKLRVAAVSSRDKPKWKGFLNKDTLQPCTCLRPL